MVMMKGNFQNMFLQNEGQEEIVENNNKKAKW